MYVDRVSMSFRMWLFGDNCFQNVMVLIDNMVDIDVKNHPVLPHGPLILEKLPKSDIWKLMETLST